MYRSFQRELSSIVWRKGVNDEQYVIAENMQNQGRRLTVDAL